MDLVGGYKAEMHQLGLCFSGTYSPPSIVPVTMPTFVGLN